MNQSLPLLKENVRSKGLKKVSRVLFELSKKNLNKMWEQLRILYLLLRKNFIVRKRHTLGSIVELLIPACIIGLILVARSNYDVEPNHVKENTYFPLITRGELIDDHLQRSLFHLYYKPRNELTNNLTREVARCMDLKEHGKHYKDGLISSSSA